MQKLLITTVGIAVLGGVIIILAGVLGWVVIPNVIDDKIAEEVQLTPGSETWEKWSDIPYPIYLNFHIHHVVNPDEVEAGGKPRFEEKGPYAYKQHRTKIELVQEDKDEPESTVQYREVKTYSFDQEASGSNKESDEVDVVNIAFIAVIHGVAARFEPIVPIVANGVLGNEKYIKRNVIVRELLFDGFDVSVYKNSFIGGLLPVEFEGGRFGLYKGENGTPSEVYNIYNGVGDPSRFGKIKSYNGKTKLGFWGNNTHCDKLKGTDGSIYAPFFTKDRQIDVFSTDLCRSLTLAYEDDMEHLGIKGYRFTVPKWVLEDPRTNKDNKCYCPTVPLEKCPRGGAISLESCRGGAPIMMSTPYFLDGDDGYWSDSGLVKSDREKHVTFIDVEPNSGLVLRAHKRIQVNVDVRTRDNVKQLKNITQNIVFPLLWADESAELDQESADDLNGKLLKPLKIVNVTKWVLIGVGTVVLVGACIAFAMVRRRNLLAPSTKTDEDTFVVNTKPENEKESIPVPTSPVGSSTSL